MTSNYAQTSPQYGAPRYATPSPAYGTPLPVYGAPAFDGQGARRRPGTVIAAAVLAFVNAALVFAVLFPILGWLGIFAIMTKLAPMMVAIFFAALLLVLSISGLYVWGGVAALKGRRGILVVISTIQLSLSLLGLALSLTADATSRGAALGLTLQGLIFVVPILILILKPSNADFFRARSRNTI